MSQKHQEHRAIAAAFGFDADMQDAFAEKVVVIEADMDVSESRARQLARENFEKSWN